GAFGGGPEVPLLRERRVHRREWQLEDVGGGVALDVPRVERTRDAGAEADRIREAERRVVAKRKLREVSVRVDAEVVVAMAQQRARERLELRLLVGEAPRIVRRVVAPVQADLAAGVADRLDQPRPQLVVALRRRAVVRIVVSSEDEERRAGALALEDLAEPPVRIGPTHPMDRRGREGSRLAKRRRRTDLEDMVLQPGGGAAQTDARPALGCVDVVRQRNREPVVCQAEPPAQTLERRVERIELRPLGAVPTVLVARATALFNACKVVEAGC